MPAQTPPNPKNYIPGLYQGGSVIGIPQLVVVVVIATEILIVTGTGTAIQAGLHPVVLGLVVAYQVLGM